MPTVPDIEQQLQRMLLSPVFTEAETQAQLLEYLVRAALDGETVTEKTIIADLFPFYLRDPGTVGSKPSSIVRVFKNKLLERLNEYYADEGDGDLVIIALLSKPRRKGYKPLLGEAYRPVFRYNPDHSIDQDYRRALYHLSQGLPGDDGIALDYFNAVLMQKPDHAYAHAGKAEIYLRWAMYYHVRLTPAKSLKLAQQSVTEAIRLQPKLWRGHAIQGGLYCCTRRWEQAQASFELALQCDSVLTRYGAWYYPAFLLARNKTAEALSLVKERARSNPDDLSSQLLLGIFLCLTGRLDEALLSLTIVDIMNTRHWLAHVAAALLALARKEPSAPHVILVHQLLDEPIFPGLLAYCLAAGLRLRAAPEESGISSRHAAGSLFAQIYTALDDLVDTLPKPDEQLQTLLKLSKRRYVPPLQIALAYMANGDQRQALKSLNEAFSEPDPLMAWVHLMPLFDALRKQKGFQALTHRPAVSSLPSA